MELARAGRCEEAMRLAAAHAAAEPSDVTALHRAGAAFALCGDGEQALIYLEAALRVHPDFHYTEIEIAGVHAARSDYTAALAWYLKAVGSAPHYLLAYRLAADTLVRLHRPPEAELLLRQARAIDPTDPVLAAQLVDVLILLNRREDAWPVFDPVIAAGRMRDEDHLRRWTLLSEVGRYAHVISASLDALEVPRSSTRHYADVLSGHAKLAGAFDRAAVLAAAKAREAGGRWRTAEQTVTALKAAIAECRPMSFVRVGDGEARFLAYGDPHSRKFVNPSEAVMLGELPFQNWFGVSLEQVPHADVAMLGAEALMAYRNADILGVPSAARLAVDNLHFGYLAFMEDLLENIRASGDAPAFADSMGHVEIDRLSRFYRNIIGGLDFIGVVSPHPGLAERLARACGVGAWAEHLIPGESRLPLDARRRNGAAHFPERYLALRGELLVPRPGAVFLVAAGLPGKVYCDWLRRRGAVAIDAGSIVDAWMGYDTRPGQFGALSELRLPD